MTAGRPTDYCQETAERVLNLMGSGLSLRRICEENSDLPHRDTIFEWLLRHPEFSDRYAEAKEVRADSIADDVLVVAEDVESGTLGPREGHVLFKAKTWFASVTAPHKYADRRQLQHTGPDGGPLEVHHIGHEERQARIAELEAKRGPLIESTAKVIE